MVNRPRFKVGDLVVVIAAWGEGVPGLVMIVFAIRRDAGLWYYSCMDYEKTIQFSDTTALPEDELELLDASRADWDREAL